MSGFVEFIREGGLMMYPLLALSFVCVGVIIERVMAFKELGNTTPGLLNQVLASVQQGEFDRAERLCATKRGPVAAALRIILKRRDEPVQNIERLVEEVGQDVFTKLERFLPILDTTTTVSPLMGLLGTLLGMIGTFQGIARQSGQAANDSVMSGIGQSLYATATGLTIAMICFVAYNWFSSRLRTVVSETEQAATKLINTLIALEATGPASAVAEELRAV
jgi:biopolymer transport protein ExbB